MKNKKFKFYSTALVLDGIDFILGVGGWIGIFTTLGIAEVVNEIRGVIYDTITIPIVYSKYGGKAAIIDSIELVIPDAIDFVIPTATIGAYISRRK
jgi:hypothetical protein